ncbi:MAG: DUF427 domain-containing protein [Fidelibacterota bacterium]
MNGMKVTIKNASTGEIIASSSNPLRFESYYYFDERDVNADLLVVSDRIYTCSYKGQCFWIDLRSSPPEEGNNGIVQENVAWVYRTPQPGFEEIKGKIGFWPTNRGHVSVEVTEGPE